MRQANKSKSRTPVTVIAPLFPNLQQRMAYAIHKTHRLAIAGGLQKMLGRLAAEALQTSLLHIAEGPQRRNTPPSALFSAPPMLCPMPVQSRGWAPHSARTPCLFRVWSLPAAPGGRTLLRTHAAPLHSLSLSEARLSVPGAGAVGRPAPGHTHQESSRPL